jgi:fatty-acyl-CoA synthase
MKVCFSTLGCPNWTLGEILAAAKDLGYDGIELRGLGEDIYLPDAAMFSGGNAKKAKARFDEMRLEVPCVSGDCMLSSEGSCLAEAEAYIELAADLGCPNVRLLGDKNPAPSDHVDDQKVIENLKALLSKAQKAGVALLIETNGVYSDTARLKKVIEAANSPHAAVLWDVNHPVRYAGESPEETWANIGRYVRHMHVKDSVKNGETVYKMLGYGDLPLKEVFDILKKNGYGGYVSLEWTKRWNRELEDAGIVFAHYIYAVRKYIG